MKVGHFFYCVFLSFSNCFVYICMVGTSLKTIGNMSKRDLKKALRHNKVTAMATRQRKVGNKAVTYYDLFVDREAIQGTMPTGLPL